MIIPTIHQNGTSKESLMADLLTVAAVLDGARQALAATTPHGRDYYPQGPDALKAATEEHVSRVARILSVTEEINCLLAAIDQL